MQGSLSKFFSALKKGKIHIKKKKTHDFRCPNLNTFSHDCRVNLRLADPMSFAGGKISVIYINYSLNVLLSTVMERRLKCDPPQLVKTGYA